MDGAMGKGVVIDETIEGLFQCARDFGGATGARSVPQALRALMREALHPFPEGSMGQVEGLGDGVDVMAHDHLTDGLGTAKDAGLLGLLAHGFSGRQRLSGQVALQGAHRLAP
jgi:hypothetical protein